MTDEEREIQTRAALASVEARAFVWWILEEAGIFRTTFVPGAFDQSAWNEGRRSLGLQVLERIERDAPGSTDQMKREANDVSNASTGTDTGSDAPARSGSSGGTARSRARARRAAADYAPDAFADADPVASGDT